MLGLPKSTEIRKNIFKKVIYEKFKNELTSAKKLKFDEDISKIILVNELSTKTLNIQGSENTKPIFVLNIILKNKNYNEETILMITKLFAQKMVLLLQYENEAQLCAYQIKLIKNDWKNIDEQFVSIVGLDLNTIWENIVMQIGNIVLKDDNSLDKQITLNIDNEKILNKIQLLKNKILREKQPRKKLELKQKINALKLKLK